MGRATDRALQIWLEIVQSQHFVRAILYYPNRTSALSQDNKHPVYIMRQLPFCTICISHSNNVRRCGQLDSIVHDAMFPAGVTKCWVWLKILPLPLNLILWNALDEPEWRGMGPLWSRPCCEKLLILPSKSDANSTSWKAWSCEVSWGELNLFNTSRTAAVFKNKNSIFSVGAIGHATHVDKLELRLNPSTNTIDLILPSWTWNKSG